SSFASVRPVLTPPSMENRQRQIPGTSVATTENSIPLWVMRFSVDTRLGSIIGKRNIYFGGATCESGMAGRVVGRVYSTSGAAGLLSSAGCRGYSLAAFRSAAF